MVRYRGASLGTHEGGEGIRRDKGGEGWEYNYIRKTLLVVSERERERDASNLGSPLRDTYLGVYVPVVLGLAWNVSYMETWLAAELLPSSFLLPPHACVYAVFACLHCICTYVPIGQWREGEEEQKERGYK